MFVPQPPSMLQLRNLQREVIVEAGLDEELQVKVVGEWLLLGMRYRFRMLMSMITLMSTMRIYKRISRL